MSKNFVGKDYEQAKMVKEYLLKNPNLPEFNIVFQQIRAYQANKDYIFTNIILYTNKEKAVLPIAVSTAFKYINKKHLFPKHIHAHMLRHTHVSLLAETRKVSLTDIQARLGHSTDETTRRVYLHVTEKSKIDTAKIFEEYMAK